MNCETRWARKGTKKSRREKSCKWNETFSIIFIVPRAELHTMLHAAHHTQQHTHTDERLDYHEHRLNLKWAIGMGSSHSNETGRKFSRDLCHRHNASQTAFCDLTFHLIDTHCERIEIPIRSAIRLVTCLCSCSAQWLMQNRAIEQHMSDGDDWGMTKASENYWCCICNWHQNDIHLYGRWWRLSMRQLTSSIFHFLLLQINVSMRRVLIAMHPIGFLV